MDSQYNEILNLLGQQTRSALPELFKTFGIGTRDSDSGVIEFESHFFSVDEERGRILRANFYFNEPYCDSEFRDHLWKGGLPFCVESTDSLPVVEQKVGESKRLSIFAGGGIQCATFDLSQYILSFTFDESGQNLYMLQVEFVGVFSDSGLLETSYFVRDETTDVVQELFRSGTETPEYKTLHFSKKVSHQHCMRLQILSGASESESKIYSELLIHRIRTVDSGSVPVLARFEAQIDGILSLRCFDEETGVELAVTEC